MRTKMFVSAAVLVVPGVFAPAAIGQTTIMERLDPTSQLTAHLCRGACACPPHDVAGGIRGRLVLRQLPSDPLYDHYRVTNVEWVSDINGVIYRFTGSGTYRVGGEVARMHQLTLTLNYNDLPLPPSVFDSGLVAATGRQFPHIDILIQSGTIGCTEFDVDVRTSVTCRSDWDSSGVVDPADLAAFVNTWFDSLTRGTLDGDDNGDGLVTPADVASFVGEWFADVSSSCV